MIGALETSPEFMRAHLRLEVKVLEEEVSEISFFSPIMMFVGGSVALSAGFYGANTWPRESLATAGGLTIVGACLVSVSTTLFFTRLARKIHLQGLIDDDVKRISLQF